MSKCNAGATEHNAPQAFRFAILRWAIWYRKSTLNSKLITEFIKFLASKFSTIVSKPLNVLSRWQICFMSLQELLKCSKNKVRLFALEKHNVCKASCCINKTQGIGVAMYICWKRSTQVTVDTLTKFGKFVLVRSGIELGFTTTTQVTTITFKFG